MMRSSACLTLALVVIGINHGSVNCGEKMDIEGLVRFAKPMRNSCVRKTGVDPVLVDNVRAKGEFPRDPKLMCFFRCISIMLKVMNKRYEITYSMVKQQVDLLVQEETAAKLLKVTKNCIESITMTEDSCLNAWELVRCAYITDKSTYFIP